MEEENALPPFWLQSSSTLQQANYDRRRRLSRASSFLLNSSAFLVVLLVIVLCFILIVIPKFLHFTSQLLRPQSVKKSWDSLNLVLVLFAIVCGFLSRNTNDDRGEDRSVSSKRAMKSNPSTPRPWYEYSDDRAARNTVNRLRSSSSYPDLRLQEPSLGTGDERWRFYDDTQVPNHRFPTSDQLHRHREAPQELEHEDLGAKSTGFNRSEIREEVYSQPPVPSPPQSPPPQVSPPRSPSPPPTPPPPVKTPTVVKRKPERKHVVHRPDEEVDQQHKNVNPEVTDIQRLQLPPLSPPSFYQESEHRSGKNEKKRGGTTKEFLTSLRRKKKKQRQKSIESFETIISSQRPSTSLLPPSSPPPPPPLPPPSVFHNLFSSKKGKSKKGQSVSPAQPPPSSIASQEPKPDTEDESQLSKPHEPPPMEVERLSSLNDEEYKTRIGGDSPLHPIPPPPPPPPFRISDWKFVAHGDFVSIRSNSSSPRAGSPDLDESEADGPPASGERSTLTGSSALIKDTTTPMFCSSPDVNSKADKFIARFRADLKLQKMNSMKEKKARKRSNLGREQSPGPE